MAELAGKILVTGADGGIGRALVAELLTRPEVEAVYAGVRAPETPSPALAALRRAHAARLSLCPVDLEDEARLAALAETLGEIELTGILQATGCLHGAIGGRPFGPERRLLELDPAVLEKLFRVNATGPLLLLKHLLPRCARHRPLLLAQLSARVGSIADNRLGGWYGYRSSKAALNMLTKCLAIELARTHPKAICVGLHPGTVDTPLSRPFQKNVPPSRLFSPARAARQLLEVLEGLPAQASGQVFAWDGTPIPP